MVAEIHVDDYLDYLTPDGLTRISGVREKYHIALAIKELVDNAIDSSEGYCSIDWGNNDVSISDEGPGIPGSDEEIAYLFSVNRKTYSTKGERYPRRGYMGRGLRFVAGVVYCYSATLKVSTRGRTLLLEPGEKGTTYKRIAEGDNYEDGTTIYIKFPQNIDELDLFWGRLANKLAQGPEYKGYSSPWWYDSRSFHLLLKSIDYRNKKVIHVIKELFGGRYSIKVFDKRIQSLLKQRNAEEITLEDSKEILEKLKMFHKPVKPSRLGYVGRLSYSKRYFYIKKYGYYEKETDDEEESLRIPYIVELWAKPSDELVPDKNKYFKKYGEVLFFINKSPVPILPIDIYSDGVISAEINLRMNCISLKKITEFYININTPYLPIVSGSKKPSIPDEINKDIQKLFLKLIKKINRDYKTRSSSGERQRNSDKKEIKEIKNKVSNENYSLLEKENLTEQGSKYLKINKDDPFFTGESYAKITQALWFQEIWNRLNPDNKLTHLRRLHYQIVSQPTKVMRHTNKPYENTDSCWAYLLKTSKFARELGLLDPLKIIDRRAPPPYGRFVTSFESGKEIDFPSWSLPEIRLDTLRIGEFRIPEFKINMQLAFRTLSALQPVHLEIWTEKATMNDILEDICRKYGIILVQNVGYASITNIEIFLRERAMKTEKPSVILYISDYDPAGENMPVTVSRTLQHRIIRLRNEGLLSDKKEVCVHPIILTQEQMESQEFAILPKAPRRGKKERGATELDALEALMPGKFREIVEENIEKYLDKELVVDLPKIVESERNKFSEILRDSISLQTDQLLDIRKKLSGIEGKYRKKLETIQDSIKKEIAPYVDVLNSLREEIGNQANKLKDELEINISTNKTPYLDDSVLFLSSRSFKEQTERLIDYRVFR